MSLNERVVQDRRRFSRIAALLDCEVKYRGITLKAVIVDLSLNGALLSSKYLPPKGDAVTVFLQSPQLKEPLALESTVVRGAWAMSEGEDRSFSQAAKAHLLMSTRLRRLIQIQLDNRIFGDGKT